MKKTIITLLALAGVASADYTGSFSWGAQQGAAFTFEGTDAIALILEGGSSITAGYNLYAERECGWGNPKYGRNTLDARFCHRELFGQRADN